MKKTEGKAQNSEIYDVIIIGAGCSGYAAAMYAGRFDMKTLVLGEMMGGTIILTDVVENYPGFKKLTGQELADKLKEHALDYKSVEMKNERVEKVEKSGKLFNIHTKKNKYASKTVIIATGTKVRRLNVPGEDEFANQGVSYCALCLHPDEEVVANSSITKIKDVTPITRVLTHDGTYKEVAGFTKTEYNGELIKIRTRFFNEPVSLTPNHPVYRIKVTKGTGNKYLKDFKIGKPEWIEAGKLEKGDCLVYPIIKETKDTEKIKISDYIEVKETTNGRILPFINTITSNEIDNIIPITKDFMRLVGYYIAEGSASKHNLKFYFNKKEKNYIEDVKEILEKTFKLNVDISYVKNVCNMGIYSKVLADLFKHLFGNYSYNKNLPHWAMLLPAEKQKELIKGMWRGDGRMRDKDFCYVTSSRKLAYQLRDLLLRQSIIPSLQVRDKTGLNRKQNRIEGRLVKFNHNKYNLNVGGQFLENMSSILDARHPKLNQRSHILKHAWIKDGNAILPIRNIEKTDYVGDVLNIAVKENNTYVAKNFIVHNCDGPLFRNKVLAVVGGSDSAAKEALLLTQYASKVYIIYRGDKIHPEPINEDRVKKNKKIEVIANTNITEIKGDKKVTHVILDKPYKGSKEFKLDGIFVEIGHIPLADFVKPIGVKLNQKGEIIIDRTSSTNVPGLFAAGDVVDTKFKQAITGVGEAVSATYSAYQYINENEVITS